VIASGGAGTADHAREALADGHADAVALASIVHYHAVQALPVPEGTREGNTEYLRAMRTPSRIAPCPVGEVADHLAGAGYSTRSTMARHVGA
jgi:imidazole glycerol-phosphate synthase subunit HisF